MTPDEERAQIARIAALVTERVKEALAQPSTPSAPAPAPSGPRVLAVLASSGPVTDPALTPVADLARSGCCVDVLLPDGPQGVAVRERVGALSGVTLVDARATPGPAALVAPYALVVVPALDRCAAAHLALGLTDTLELGVIWDALWRGVPVVAAHDGVERGPDQAPEAMRRVVQGHLSRLAEFGVRWVDSSGIVAAVREALAVEPPQQPALPRTVITSEDVRQAAEEGRECIRAGAGSQVTDMARELARRLGVRIELR